MTRWQTVQLRHLTQCLDGRRVPLNSEQRAEAPGDYPYWGANGIVDTVGDYLFDEALILLGEDGAPFGDPLKDVAFLVEGRVWVNNHIHALRPLGGVDQRFLTYALNSVDWPKFITGSTREKLTQDDMNRVRVECPDRGTQRAIADYLDTETARIDALITAKRRMMELLRERRNALLMHRIHKCWTSSPHVPLKRVAQKVQSAPHDGDEILTAYRDGEVTARSVRRAEGYTVADDESNYQHVDEGDFVFHGLDGFAGATGVASMSGKCSPVYHACKMLLDNDAQFLALQVRGLAKAGYLELQASSVRQRAVDLRNWERFGAIEVARVDPEVQRSLAQEVRRYEASEDAFRGLLTRQIQLLLERRQALITAAVTGELEVPGVAA